MVEKFAGDAVMAAFGVPRTHEDDAAARPARRVRGPRRRCTSLGLEARIGVEAGEVVVDEAESTFATGEPVNIAARLQQAAGPARSCSGRSCAGSPRAPSRWRTPGRSRSRAAPSRSGRGARSARSTRRSGVAAAWFIGRDQELELLAERARAHDPRPARESRHRLRRARDRQDAARLRVRRRRRARDRAQRPRASVRRGHHLLAARLDDQDLGRHHRRRARVGGVREAPALLRERGGRRPARGRARRARRGRGRAHAPAS